MIYVSCIDLNELEPCSAYSKLHNHLLNEVKIDSNQTTTNWNENGRPDRGVFVVQNIR